MNDHNLDDLIIDDIAPNNSKAKSLLTIVALLIIVFIVAIIFTSVLLEDPKSDPLLLEENDTEMISPELTLQHIPKTKKEKTEPKLNEIIEKELNEPIQHPKAPKVKETVPPKKEETKKPEKIEAPKIVPENDKTKSVEITKEFEQTPKVPEAKAVPEKIDAPKTVVLTPTPKNTDTHKNTTTPSASDIQYYIQVGSYRQTPSKRFLSVIKNNGFSYKITAPAANGIKKLLIGPYRDRNSVNTALIRVRDLINKNAFVVKK